MTYKKITITFLLCCFSLLGIGQVERYSVEQTSGMYGIYKDGKECVVPPIFNHLSTFNSNGLSLAMRRIPFVSIGLGFWDTVFWKKYYPNKFLKNTIYLNEYYPDKFLFGYKMGTPNNAYTCFTNGNDTQFFERKLITPEELMIPSSNDYMDSMGNYYLNIFPEMDPYGYHNHYSIDLYGIIDTNGRIVQPLIYQNISFENDFLRSQKIYTFVYRNKVGFIDSTGKIIISSKYDRIDYFDDRYMLQEGDVFESYNFIDNLCEVVFNNAAGVIDTKGNTILPFIYHFIRYEYVNSDYPRKIHRIHTIDFNGNKQVFDKTGKEIKE